MAARRMSSSTPPPLLRRYTDLTSVIDLLTHKRLTLLNPASWDDKNDRYFIDHYRERSDYQSVLALCLSTVGETYHHWKVFCGHASGVCIAFHRQPLLDVIDAAEGVRHGKVKYMRLEEIAEKPPRLNRLPFIKRYAFRHELEYRLIYESKTDTAPTHAVPIPLKTIEGIALSPWMPTPLLNATRSALKAISGCETVTITRSELISNSLWMQNAERSLRGEPLLAGTPLEETEPQRRPGP